MICLVRVVPVSGISTRQYPASRVSGLGWRCNSLSRTVPLPVHLTNSLIIFADAADTLREKNVLRPTVNSHRPRIYGRLASIGSHVAIPIARRLLTCINSSSYLAESFFMEQNTKNMSRNYQFAIAIIKKIKLFKK